MKIGQEASQLGLASERYRISYRQLSESAPAVQCAGSARSDHSNIFSQKKIQSYQKLLITPLISQLQSLSLPHKYVINCSLIIDIIFTH